MTSQPSLRRMAENQVVFRKMNEQAMASINELSRIADDDKRMDDMRHDGQALQFYCECSDENCRKRIAITPDIYDNIHSLPDQFTILPGHNVPAIESTVAEYATFIVVKKFSVPSQSTTKLTITPINNAS
ncbi:hypothetical protein A2707_00825 [Candidatus Saccharibacteria bacterium RIFCSPHIGHO2_01_FULL_45_15]|nr:MAG: hypothetical protein A2707_00825 [Candidatus Saccharibacteria bacterium RIFCSPHIGHO2_01_FULL_45_15]OGL26916.1 MAG: hypothetical protein A3C39_01940 [Candidatus Saccharibacteria bacterium RIFCSPHIGHO2_02_FULL_46_12]OGL32268.1 MAG: hypothetical protein A3E76_02645 [Candidatus Saccharibacteria bacterium RIFCSPHIGHO2_12_FULL_44_22]